MYRLVYCGLLASIALGFVYPLANTLVLVAVFVYVAYRLYAKRVDEDIGNGERRRHLVMNNRMVVPSHLDFSSEYVCVPDHAEVETKDGEGEDPSGKGTLLFTSCVRPQDINNIKGVVFMCHGYLESSHNFILEQAVNLAKHGYAVHMLDQRGFGRSDGLYGHIDNFHTLVLDANYIFSRVKNKFYRYIGNIKYFLYGNSLGGCVALQVAFHNPSLVDGAVLTSPMVQVAKQMRPPQWQIDLLTRMADVFPAAAIVPVPNTLRSSIKNEDIYQRKVNDALSWGAAKPRLRTSVSINATVTKMESQLADVSIPFLVLHGLADTVTSCQASQDLFKQAKSTDKSIELVEGAWHALLEYDGFDNPVSQGAFKKIISWLNLRARKPVT